MATTADTLAAKQAKQKKILIVLGVLLLALAAFQGPKLWKQVNGGSTSAAATSAEEEQAAAASAAAAATGAPAAETAQPAAATPTAALVGVGASTAARPTPGPGQLRSFTLFVAKDPFVQALPAETSGATASTTEPTLSDTQPAGGGSSDAGKADAKDTTGTTGSSSEGSGSGSSSQSAPPEPAPQYATIIVNGTPQPLELTDRFPQQGKTFVLVSLKPKLAEVGVAGGKLVGSKTLDLKMGKSVTLVNTATGARYVLKLVYTGSAPEQVEEFSPGASTAK
jgi:hypothetical protein